MEKTGITRRIDELGRLVIPKEIRKNLKIKDNDQVEILVVNDEIVLKKYESLKKDKIVNYLINAIRKYSNKNVLFTSRDKIIDYSIVNKNELDNIILTTDYMNLIEGRKDIINFTNKDLVYSIFPLIINGDLYGSLIINGKSDITSHEIEIIKFCVVFLENYLE